MTIRLQSLRAAVVLVVTGLVVSGCWGSESSEVIEPADIDRPDVAVEELYAGAACDSMPQEVIDRYAPDAERHSLDFEEGFDPGHPAYHAFDYLGSTCVWAEGEPTLHYGNPDVVGTEILVGLYEFDGPARYLNWRGDFLPGGGGEMYEVAVGDHGAIQVGQDDEAFPATRGIAVFTTGEVLVEIKIARDDADPDTKDEIVAALSDIVTSFGTSDPDDLEKRDVKAYEPEFTRPEHVHRPGVEVEVYDDAACESIPQDVIDRHTPDVEAKSPESPAYISPFQMSPTPHAVSGCYWTLGDIRDVAVFDVAAIGEGVLVDMYAFDEPELAHELYDEWHRTHARRQPTLNLGGVLGPTHEIAIGDQGFTQRVYFESDPAATVAMAFFIAGDIVVQIRIVRDGVDQQTGDEVTVALSDVLASFGTPAREEIYEPAVSRPEDIYRPDMEVEVYGDAACDSIPQDVVNHYVPDDEPEPGARDGVSICVWIQEGLTSMKVTLERFDESQLASDKYHRLSDRHVWPDGAVENGSVHWPVRELTMGDQGFMHISQVEGSDLTEGLAAFAAGDVVVQIHIERFGSDPQRTGNEVIAALSDILASFGT